MRIRLTSYLGPKGHTAQHQSQIDAIERLCNLTNCGDRAGSIISCLEANDEYPEGARTSYLLELKPIEYVAELERLLKECWLSFAFEVCL